jgi:tRNA uridine 5-carboxymethylaminomethyl modification enzyme
MLTARAEYRLRLRADNADARLTPIAIEIGCVSSVRQERFAASREERARIELLLSQAFSASGLRGAGMHVRDDGIRRSGAEWLRFPEVDAPGLKLLIPELAARSESALEEAVQDHRYAPYVARQEGEVARVRADEAVVLPPNIVFSQIPGLSNEMVERLAAARPATLGAASRVRGISPAALAAILVHARRRAA